MKKAKIKKSKAPMVGLVMGSDSDWKVMKAAAELLKEFSIPFEKEIVSAHRTPHKMYEYAASAKLRGLRVIIAGAGGSAHLPGMIASLTTIPVIGVPVETKKLQGLDSLLSIVQMPKGIPVATVAIDNAHNAALLAARILAFGAEQAALQKSLERYQFLQTKQVSKKKLP